MVCFLDSDLDQLRTDDEFKGWLQKIKDSYPDKSDTEVEDMLVTFMQANNGNFPGNTPFGERENPVKSSTFEQLVNVFDGDEVSAMEVYGNLFGEEFIKEFGDWTYDISHTEGMTPEERDAWEKENQSKLDKSVRNELGEPALLFVDSIKHKASHADSVATSVLDKFTYFKIFIENGEARLNIGYDRPVQNGSITFAISKGLVYPIDSNSRDEIQMDVSDIEKLYDFESENKGFTEKRLDMFISQSTKDLYTISYKINEVNRSLYANANEIHNEQEAIDFIKTKHPQLVFDTDKDSPFGYIHLMQTKRRKKDVWQIISPEGIFYNFNRYAVDGTFMLGKTQTKVDILAETFFIDSGLLKSITDYIISNITVVRPDSYLSTPIVDYERDQFILKPSYNRTQHNIKTEFGLTYAVYLFHNKPDKFKTYSNWAKQFPEIRQNSVGEGVIQDVNMVGNLIGSLLSGQIYDANYYVSHQFDQAAVNQAVFVSKHQLIIREMVDKIQEDIIVDIQSKNMLAIHRPLAELYKMYKKTDFSDVSDDIAKNRTASKLDVDAIPHSFCDTIDNAKAAYNYRRNDSGSKKAYDATEYTKIAAAYEQLNVLNKQIKAYLMKTEGTEDVVTGENVEKLIGQYLTCISTIVGIMDDDISRLEDFIWNGSKEYTPEYFSNLLYFDRSVISMYKKQKDIIDALFRLDLDDSGIIQKTLYNLFSNQQVRIFEELRGRYYENYEKLTTLKHGKDRKESLDSIISNMISNAIQYICDDWCDKNLRCLTVREERFYRENLKLDLEGHIKAGMPLDVAIGAASASGHNIINVLYRIIQTQQNRSNLLIKQKGDLLTKKFKDTFDNHNPFNQCKQFCETLDGKTTGYFKRAVNYGQYYRAKVRKQRELLAQLPKDSNGRPYYIIDEDKSTETKLVIEWGVNSEEYQNRFLDDMDRWIEKNANRRYTAQYYIDRRRILGKERNGIIVGNEAANRQNILRRQIDGIKNRYKEKVRITINGEEKEVNVFLPHKVPPVQKKILQNLEHQLADLSSPYEKYVNSDGEPGIREKSGLDLAIALNIQEWNKYIQDKRSYSQDTERYNLVEQALKDRIGKGLKKEDFDSFVKYYHKLQAKQEYYDTIEEMYKGLYGDKQKDIDDIRLKRRSILSRVKNGPKGLLQFPDLDALTDAEWAVLKSLDEKEQEIKDKYVQPIDVPESISSSLDVVNERTGKTFIDEHRAANKVHEYIDSEGMHRPLSVYSISVPKDFNDMTETVLTDEFSVEESEYINKQFDQSNSSYEQPKAYDDNGKKLYKNDEFDKIKNNPKLFDLYNTFLDIMQEANQMFGYAAISSNYKLPQIYERQASVFLGRGCSFLNAYKYKLKRDFLVDERDLDRSYTSDIHADNSHSGKLRKRFVEMLSDPEHVSTDLVYSVMAYYTTACRYSDKQDVEAQCELIKRKIQGSATASDRLKDQANNTIETFLYENTMNTNSSVAAFVERFGEHTTATLLKWKLKSAIKAFLDGYRLLTNVLLANKWNMRGHFLDSTSKAIRQTFSSIRSSIDVLDYNLSEALMSLNNINIQSYADVNKTKFTRAYYKSGMMPMLTTIDHITTKSIMLSVYDSIRLYTSPDGKKQFLNLDEFIETYKRDHKEKDDILAKQNAEDLFWGKGGKKVITLYDAYQLGRRDKSGKIIKGTENILNIKDEYANMFSSDEKENDDYWTILQTRVQGQIDIMAASINGFKPEDSKAGTFSTRWYLKPIFQIRSFLISNYNELFKHSTVLKDLVEDTSTRNTSNYIPREEKSTNSTAKWIDKLWSSDYNIVRLINNITSEQEMYNVLTGTKDIGYYFGAMSGIRKLIENFTIYCGNIIKHEKDGFRNITDAEKASVITMFLVIGEAITFYNMEFFIAGLLCCLLGQGSAPDDEDEYFIHWFLWTLYDIAGSMFNDTLVSLPTGDTISEIFKNIIAMSPVLDQFKKSTLNQDDAREYLSSLFGDSEVFEDPEYGTDTSPFNLIKSGKWQNEMYGKRRVYEVVQNAPWLLSPVLLQPFAYVGTSLLPELPIANLKESFSASSAKAKASYTFNNLSPLDYFTNGVPSRTEESWNKFHNYGFTTFMAGAFNYVIGGQQGEEEILEYIRDISKSPVVPSMSPVDKVERMFPYGRQYE